MNPKGVVEAIDKKIVLERVISLYSEKGVLRPIYQVSADGNDYVLKLTNSDEKKHFDREVAGLEVAKGISGVTQLVRVYPSLRLDSGLYFVLLKYYFPGKDLLERPVMNDNLSSQLRAAVGQLHQRSLVHLDLFPQNIVASDDAKTVKIIDLGNCFVFSGTQIRFEQLRKKDLDNLEILLRKHV